MPFSSASHNPVKSEERQVILLTCTRGDPRVLILSLLDRVERGGSGWSREASVFGPYALHCADGTKSYHRKPGSVWIRKFGFFPWWTVTSENCQLSFLFLLWVYNVMGFGSNLKGADSPACMTCVGLSSSPSSCYHGVIFFCFLLFQEENVHQCQGHLWYFVRVSWRCLPAWHRSWSPVGPHSTIVELGQNTYFMQTQSSTVDPLSPLPWHGSPTFFQYRLRRFCFICHFPSQCIIWQKKILIIQKHKCVLCASLFCKMTIRIVPIPGSF